MMQVISHQSQELHILEFQPCFPYWSLFCHTIISQETNVHKSWKLVGINIKLTMGSKVCYKSTTFYLWATHLLSWVITFLLNIAFKIYLLIHLHNIRIPLKGMFTVFPCLSHDLSKKDAYILLLKLYWIK